MTFIASVIAKKGVAIIADSLVTSQLPILHYQNFIDYLDVQPINEHGEKSIHPEDIRALFSHQPSYTKDYQEKLFKLNKFTAVTTTGIAYINDKNISDLVDEFKFRQMDLDDLAIDFESKLKQFSSFLNEQIREHLGKYPSIGYCLFMVTFYEKHSHKMKFIQTFLSFQTIVFYISTQE